VQFAAAASAIEYAVEEGASVISMSFGGGSALLAPVTHAYNEGLVVVHAAGNDDSSTPSAIDGIVQTLSVAATGSSDTKASFSNFGTWIDLSAPGVGILSTCVGGGTCSLSGTSMACPLVAGAAALLMSAQPGLDPDGVAQILAATAVDIDALNPGFAGQLGAGRIDLAAAMASLGAAVTIDNLGSGPLTVSSITPLNGWIRVGGHPATPFQVPAGGSQSFSIAAEWSQLSSDANGTVRILNNDSNEGTVNVAVTARIDDNAPPAPLAADVDPGGWTNDNGFEIDWQNPADATGIAAAWYKLGSTPSGPSDGVRTLLHPFNVNATTQGGQDLHLWLEDGRGNRDHTRRATLELSYDSTAPVVQLIAPLGGESWAAGSVQAIRWTATDSGGSGFASSPIRLDYSPDGGSSWVWIDSSEPNDGQFDWAVPQDLSGPIRVRVRAEDRADNIGGQTSGTLTIVTPNQPPLVVAPPAEPWLPATRCAEPILLGSVFADPDEDPLVFSVLGAVELDASLVGDTLRVCSPSSWTGDEILTLLADDGHNPPVPFELAVHVRPETPPQPVTPLQLVQGPEGLELHWEPVALDELGRPLAFHDGYRVYAAATWPVPQQPATLVATLAGTSWNAGPAEDDQRRFFLVVAAGTGPAQPEVLAGGAPRVAKAEAGAVR
jgi:hypothetical protein